MLMKDSIGKLVILDLELKSPVLKPESAFGYGF